MFIMEFTVSEWIWVDRTLISTFLLVYYVAGLKYFTKPNSRIFATPHFSNDGRKFTMTSYLPGM